MLNMDLTIILLANGFLLSLVLLVLLVILASSKNPDFDKRKKIKKDLVKIKEQIEKGDTE